MLTEDMAIALQNLIKEGYRHNMAIDDGLPAACESHLRLEEGFDYVERTYHGGCPIGFIGNGGKASSEGDIFYLANHWIVKVTRTPLIFSTDTRHDRTH